MGGLYVWKSEYDRDHPETIKRRFLSAFFTSCMCPPLVYIFGDPKVMFETHKIYSLSTYLVQIINHFSAFVLAQLSGSDRNQETRFRGCNRSTSRLNYGFVFRSHNYGNYNSFTYNSLYFYEN